MYDIVPRFRCNDTLHVMKCGLVVADIQGSFTKVNPFKQPQVSDAEETVMLPDTVDKVTSKDAMLDHVVNSIVLPSLLQCRCRFQISS